MAVRILVLNIKASALEGWHMIWLIVALFVLMVTPDVGARTIHVAVEGDDGGAGTEEQPMRSVAAALQAISRDGGEIRVGPGSFDMAGYGIDLNVPVQVAGAGRAATTLLNPGTIQFTAGLVVRDLTFSGGDGITLKPGSPEGNVLAGVLIERCNFQDGTVAISTGKDPVGAITDFTVSDCQFERMKSGIAIIYGDISCIEVIGNTFEQIGDMQGGAFCIVIGSNATRETTRDVVIANNVMDTIFGSTEVVDGAGREVHGVLAYGTDVAIIGNTVRNLNTGQDHEAIYMKARHSVIANNIVENCGSGAGGGDISSKGGQTSMGNVICGNIVISEEPGRGIFVNGGTSIIGNTVTKPNGSNGIDVYSLGWPVTIMGNDVEVGGKAAIYVNGGDSGGREYEWPDEGRVVIIGNTAICHDGEPLKLVDVADSTVSGNTTGNQRGEQE